jgi:hypothetical protein
MTIADTFTLAQGWQKWATGKQPWKDSFETMKRQGFEQEDYLKGFSVMIRQSPPTMRSRHKGVDDTHMGFKGRRNPPKWQIGSKSFSKMQSRQKAITRGFKGGYEIMSRSIAFGSPVANSYAQSSNITSNRELQITTSIRSWFWAAVSKFKPGIVQSEIWLGVEY